MIILKYTFRWSYGWDVKLLYLTCSSVYKWWCVDAYHRHPHVLLTTWNRYPTNPIFPAASLPISGPSSLVCRTINHVLFINNAEISYLKWQVCQVSVKSSALIRFDILYNHHSLCIHSYVNRIIDIVATAPSGIVPLTGILVHYTEVLLGRWKRCVLSMCWQRDQRPVGFVVVHPQT